MDSISKFLTFFYIIEIDKKNLAYLRKKIIFAQ